MNLSAFHFIAILSFCGSLLCVCLLQSFLGDLAQDILEEINSSVGARNDVRLRFAISRKLKQQYRSFILFGVLAAVPQAFFIANYAGGFIR